MTQWNKWALRNKVSHNWIMKKNIHAIDFDLYIYTNKNLRRWCFGLVMFNIVQYFLLSVSIPRLSVQFVYLSPVWVFEYLQIKYRR